MCVKTRLSETSLKVPDSMAGVFEIMSFDLSLWVDVVVANATPFGDIWRALLVDSQNSSVVSSGKNQNTKCFCTYESSLPTLRQAQYSYHVVVTGYTCMCSVPI